MTRPNSPPQLLLRTTPQRATELMIGPHWWPLRKGEKPTMLTSIASLGEHSGNVTNYSTRKARKNMDIYMEVPGDEGYLHYVATEYSCQTYVMRINSVGYQIHG